MTAQLDLFHAAMSHNESAHAAQLQEARYNLRQYAMENYGEEKYGLPYSATSEDARMLGEITPGKPCSNNWMGGLFRERVDGNSVWEFSGRWYSQEAKGQHARPVRIWVLAKEYLRLRGAI